MPLTIAIDGPVGAGKSTISDEVAQRLGILHLDTGAMYRAVGLCALEKGIDLQDEAAVSAMCENGEAQVSVQYENGAQRTLLNGRDVTSLIRTRRWARRPPLCPGTLWCAKSWCAVSRKWRKANPCCWMAGTSALWCSPTLP